MKKTYIVPTIDSIHLCPSRLIADSLHRGTEAITNQNEILVKEQKPTNYSVWDEVWDR